MGRAEKRKCERKLWLIVSGFCFSDFSLESEFAQFYPTLCDPVDCSPPGSSIRRILQARVLEWVASSFSRGSSQPRDRTQVSCITGRHFKLWATRGARFLIRTFWKHRDLVSLSQHLPLRPVMISNWTSTQSKGKAGMEMKGWDGTLLHDKHQLLWEQESQSCAVHIDITRGVSLVDLSQSCLQLLNNILTFLLIISDSHPTSISSQTILFIFLSFGWAMWLAGS